MRDRTGLLQELQQRQQEALNALDELERELAEVIRQWTLPSVSSPPAASSPAAEAERSSSAACVPGNSSGPVEAQ